MVRTQARHEGPFGIVVNDQTGGPPWGRRQRRNVCYLTIPSAEAPRSACSGFQRVFRAWPNALPMMVCFDGAAFVRIELLLEVCLLLLEVCLRVCEPVQG